jgi:hypothetical protein
MTGRHASARLGTPDVVDGERCQPRDGRAGASSVARDGGVTRLRVRAKG